MNYLFLEYPKCTTCKKAKKWLENETLQFEDRNIVENNPTKEELKTWIHRSKQPIKKFFNTSGILYREMGLKDRIPTLSDDELIDILSSNGMLVKRPLVICEDAVLIGFKESQWEEEILGNKDMSKQLEDKGENSMEIKALVLETLKKGGAMKGGEIAEAAGVDKKEVDKAIKDLKKEEKIISPKRCYYSINE